VPGYWRATRRESVYIVVSLVWFVLSCIYLLYPEMATSSGYEVANNVFGVFPIAWIGIELVTMMTNYRRRALHDYIGDTVVINLP
jgi:hypothetical protein